jgi:hypothetical protein
MRGDPFGPLLQALTWRCGCDPRPLETAFERALGAGGRPFEVLAGAPAALFGVRVTFEPSIEPGAGEVGKAGEAGGARRRLAEALGVADHPWGDPDWVGLRLASSGELAAKPYHRLTAGRELPGLPSPPAAAPAGRVPVMASRFEGSTELYLRLAPATGWSELARRCAALVDAAEPVVEPRPRPAPLGFWVSFAWRVSRRGRELAAVTLGADSRCWSDDREVAERWAAGLDASDREVYERSLAAVRALGRRPRGGWHAMLSWTLGPPGPLRRAASLRVPPPEREREGAQTAGYLD